MMAVVQKLVDAAPGNDRRCHRTTALAQVTSSAVSGPLFNRRKSAHHVKVAISAVVVSGAVVAREY
jgi:hypothetical protein